MMLLLLLFFISGFDDVVAVVVGRNTTATIGRYQKSNIASSLFIFITIIILKIILNISSFTSD